MQLFGLIGFPLTHSFSKKYFTEKFEELGISKEYQYELYEIEDPTEFPKLFSENPDLKGINITIPHKQSVFQYLDALDISAEKVGAVNVVKRTTDNKLVGYNSDYYGFQRSLLEFLGEGYDVKKLKALILGYGGAAKAVVAALEDLGVTVQLVSRKASDKAIDYKQSETFLGSHKLIVNCSPLGTYPKTDQCPAIDYEQLTASHFLFDLVYNPPESLFLKNGKEKGAQIKNGYDMLVYQAEKSWEIWQK
ncbi:shikimate dehydrogenase family protein [Arcticibacterium luteifluviistationis]|uniref:Shikimate dehydrogenase n=1 Tax=Arcticibacterium luteifluviistationis TaxID=1784714 RepID=A0A2Z4G9E4_9BACT|nr:shikimate dehydrogenase [Arcticibacterium luteifluviistationis]AWV97852.1 shikimate dehydrogenase [Arcticibacterium luteifluviistationis]